MCGKSGSLSVRLRLLQFLSGNKGRLGSIPLPFLVAKCIAADLNDYTGHQHLLSDRLAIDVGIANGAEHDARASDVHDGVFFQNVVVFEKVDVALLIAADDGARFVENELLTG